MLMGCPVLYRKNESMVAALSQPQEGAQPLHFDTVYARNAVTQFRALLQKNFIIYWYGSIRQWNLLVSLSRTFPLFRQNTEVLAVKMCMKPFLESYFQC